MSHPRVVISANAPNAGGASRRAATTVITKNELMPAKSENARYATSAAGFRWEKSAFTIRKVRRRRATQTSLACELDRTICSSRALPDVRSRHGKDLGHLR